MSTLRTEFPGPREGYVLPLDTVAGRPRLRRLSYPISKVSCGIVKIPSEFPLWSEDFSFGISFSDLLWGFEDVALPVVSLVTHMYPNRALTIVPLLHFISLRVD